MTNLTTDLTTATALRDAGAATPSKQLLAALFDEDDEGKHLIDRLRKYHEFMLARDVLEEANKREDLDAESAELVRQQYALCLYKDPDLPAKGRLDDAFDILSGGADLAGNGDPETLGIAGAISRRHWELDGHRSHLERALGFYESGHQLFLRDPRLAEKDRGYTGINAAFLLDQLAQLGGEAATGPGATSELGERQRQKANEIRKQIVEGLGKLIAGDAGLRKNWWVVATLIEAHFGLGEFDRATELFERYGEGATVHPWELESTLTQLVALARLHGHIHPDVDLGSSDPARACLQVILGDRDPDLVLSADQKLGLALSGGGFRASFYEIGVLAALAEFDLLRHVQVLSTVSGGSVLGAHYYLELRHVLESQKDGAIDRSVYIDAVKRVAKDFLEGVESNIRTRVVLNPLRTLRMFFTKWDSRTCKAGDLYEEHIYQKARGIAPGPIRMRDLLIEPKDAPDGFNPRSGNWERRSKVPILVLNATSLNTGHNWQFTASWMGEPLVEVDIDANPRMRRMYYRDLEGTEAARHADLRLGHAVAASACVPGLFEPLALTELYEDTGDDTGRTTVRLVDGGVHDNQGIESLLEQDCNVLIVADASGQMTYEREPSAGALGGVLRSNSAMMARIREAQYDDVKVQREVGRRKGLAFVHLKEDLHAKPVNWQGCERPKDGTEDPRTRNIGEKLTSYGVRKTAQEKLAAIRTDLDSFSEVEAHALMYSGYRATRKEIEETIDTFPLDPTIENDWAFLKVKAALEGEEADTPEAKRLERHLEVGALPAFKVWHLDPFLRILRWIILVGGGGALLWWTRGKDWTLLSSDDIWWLVVGAIVTVVVGRWGMKLVRPQELLTHVLTGLGLALAGWIAASIHVFIFDPWFKRIGRSR